MGNNISIKPQDEKAHHEPKGNIEGAKRSNAAKDFIYLENGFEDSNNLDGAKDEEDYGHFPSENITTINSNNDEYECGYEYEDIIDRGDNDETIGCMGRVGRTKSLSSFLNNFSIENFIQTQMNRKSIENDEVTQSDNMKRSSSSVLPLSSPFMYENNNETNSNLHFSRSYAELFAQTQEEYTIEELNMPDGDTPIPDSDLSVPRKIYIVTTAALPWMTGTAVNPLLRAAYLKKGNPLHEVTIVLPWLEEMEDRKRLFGDKNLFLDGKDEQESYIRNWLREKAHLEDEADPNTGIHILFYPGRYHPDLNSIFAMGDLCSLIPDESADVCILEEPEHLNWYRAPTLGKTWQKKFKHVVGIIHTNYKEYARSSQIISGLVISPLLAGVCVIVVRAYCHKVIKLSEVLQEFAHEKENVTNVHGIRSEFLEEGIRRGNDRDNQLSIKNNSNNPSKTLSYSAEGGVYFIGKLLWVKGLDRLLRLQYVYRRSTGKFFPIDIYGSGPQESEIKNKFLRQKKSSKKKLDNTEHGLGKDDASMKGAQNKNLHERSIPAHFLGRVDHASLKGNQYKIFVNPSISEVLATTTAEAIAMGRFAILPNHPSNAFFKRFPNCLMYENKHEFVGQLQHALCNEPIPLSEELSRCLTWEAATKRLVVASYITLREEKRRERLGRAKLDERMATIWGEIGKGTKGDLLRKIFGAGPVSDQVQYVEGVENN